MIWILLTIQTPYQHRLKCVAGQIRPACIRLKSPELHCSGLFYYHLRIFDSLFIYVLFEETVSSS
jgi:hypothetical protein